MSLNDLVTKFRDTAESQVGLETFVFGELELVNTMRGKTLPMLLMTPPDSSFSNFGVDPNFENYTIALYFFDEYDQDEQKLVPLEEKWAELNTLGEQFIRQILKDINYQRLNPRTVTKNLMYKEHNDKFIRTRFEFTLQIATNCDEGTFV